MVERSAFFDAEPDANGDPDRVYQAVAWARVFRRLASDGYVPGDGAELVVLAADPQAMRVRVQTGSALVRGYFYEVATDPVDVYLDDANPDLPRIDRIVVRLDRIARTISAVVLTGTASSTPTARPLVRNDSTWDLGLATVAVAAAATSVGPADITDTRDDPAVCGRAGVAPTHALRHHAGGPDELSHGDIAGVMSADAHPQYARGTLAYAQVTALQTGITTEVDLTGLSVTVDVPAGRRIRVTGYGLFQSTVADDVAGMETYEDGARRQAGRVHLARAGVDATIHTSVVVTPAAGSHTYKLRALRAGGSGDIRLTAAGSALAFILVEDIGPA